MVLFVYDLHGVLEKGTEKALPEISNKVLKKMGYKQRFTPDDIERFYGLGWHQYLPQFIPGEPEEKYREFYSRCMEKSIQNMWIFAKHVRSADHAHDVLSAIQERGHDQILLSNVSESGLHAYLSFLGMRKYFRAAIAVDLQENPAASKMDVLSDFLTGRNYDEIVFAGDSQPDLELKCVAGGTTYYYTHPGREFKDCEADYRTHDLRDILREL